MSRRRLRMAPTCYHVLHKMPAMLAHEMHFFVDEGLVDADGERAYELVPDGICPFGLEAEGMWRASLERDISIILDVKPQSVIHARQTQRADLFVVAGWRNQQTGIWVARPGIGSLTDLRGKTVGIIDFTGISHSGLTARLRAAGVDPETEVQWMRGVSPPHNIEYLRSGQVDCTLFQGHQEAALRAEGFSVVARMRDMTPQGKADRVLAVNGTLIESEPEKLVAFLRGLLRSYWFIRNRDNFRYLVALERRMRLDSPSPSERRRVSFYSPQAQEGMPFPIDGIATGFDATFADAVANGQLAKVPDDAEIEQMCRFEFVREAHQQLAQREGDANPDLAAAQAVAERLGF